MKNFWQSSVINKNNSIRDALKVLNESSLRTILILEPDMTLLGTLTDGDIRRSILSGLSLDEDVTKAMRKSPKTAISGTSKAILIEMMKSLNIRSIPLLDLNGKVEEVVSLDNINDKKSYKNPIFIMAGGFGKRLQPLTDECPKPMLKIGERPILESIILSFIEAGFNNFYISTHFMPEIIEDYFGDGTNLGVSIKYIYEKDPLGTGGALGLLPENISKEPLIMINGDVLTTLDIEELLEYHNDHKGDATVCVRNFEYQVPFGVITGKDTLIIDMVEKPKHTHLINAGIYVLNNNIIKSVGSNLRIDMPTLLEQKICDGSDVHMFPIHEYWLDIGRESDFYKAQIDIKTIKPNQ